MVIRIVYPKYGIEKRVRITVKIRIRKSIMIFVRRLLLQKRSLVTTNISFNLKGIRNIFV